MIKSSNASQVRLVGSGPVATAQFKLLDHMYKLVLVVMIIAIGRNRQSRDRMGLRVYAPSCRTELDVGSGAWIARTTLHATHV